LSFEKVKTKLYEDHSLLISVLEIYGVHRIRKSRKYVQGALPDGDNPHSFSVNLKSEMLYTRIYTRGDFSGDKDIFDALAYISNTSISDVLKKTAEIVGVRLEYTKQEETKHDDTLSFLSSFTRYDKLCGNYHSNKPLPMSKLDMFIPHSHWIFTQEGINSDTQSKFNIMYDVLDNRIIIPIKDEDGNLVTMKGRIALDNPSIHIAKYLAYEPYSADSILYGLYENKSDIIKKRECIMTEAEKSVLKADSMDVKNVLALSKKVVSENQKKKILELQVPIVLAMDKDVSDEEVAIIAEQFCDYQDVYIIKDTNGLIGAKDSPFDCGEMIWDELYENKIKYIRGEYGKN